MPNNLTKPLVISVVDDEPRIHDVVNNTLISANIAETIDDFFDPASFLEALAEHKTEPELLILDVHFENTGLSGIDIIPFIRETHPYLPIILLTGMEGMEIEQAQDYECTYYIPKPIDPQQLIRMIRYYLGLGEKCGKRLETIQEAFSEYDQLIDILEQEIHAEKTSQTTEPKQATKKEETGANKSTERILEILQGVIKQYEMLSSFSKDLTNILEQDFPTGKRIIDSIITLDKESSMPGHNIHKVQGADNVYSLRLSHKIRLFFYQPEKQNCRRLLRIDTHHDTKGMDKWLK
ncbi:MAG TPA: response regulator, partial [Piscirickettsiaceae bacterium]|nr:response regulator [Piscirickettsiaceae bacterium]